MVMGGEIKTYRVVARRLTSLRSFSDALESIECVLVGVQMVS